MSTPDSNSSTNRLDVYFGGALPTVFTMPWGLNLFQQLEDSPGHAASRSFPVYLGSGPSDPWIEFHMPEMIDPSEHSRSVMARLACHVVLSRLPDAIVYGLLENLAGSMEVRLRYYIYLPDGANSGREQPVGVAAVITRSSDPADDLVIYQEKADRKRIEWIRRMRKSK